MPKDIRKRKIKILLFMRFSIRRIRPARGKRRRRLGRSGMLRDGSGAARRGAPVARLALKRYGAPGHLQGSKRAASGHDGAQSARAR